MKGSRKVSKSVRVSQALWNRALGKARANNMTMEKLIDKLLTEYLKEEEKGR